MHQLEILYIEWCGGTGGNLEGACQNPVQYDTGLCLQKQPVMLVLYAKERTRK